MATALGGWACIIVYTCIAIGSQSKITFGVIDFLIPFSCQRANSRSRESCAGLY